MHSFQIFLSSHPLHLSRGKPWTQRVEDTVPGTLLIKNWIMNEANSPHVSVAPVQWARQVSKMNSEKQKLFCAV